MHLTPSLEKRFKFEDDSTSLDPSSAHCEYAVVRKVAKNNYRVKFFSWQPKDDAVQRLRDLQDGPYASVIGIKVGVGGAHCQFFVVSDPCVCNLRVYVLGRRDKWQPAWCVRNYSDAL